MPTANEIQTWMTYRDCFEDRLFDLFGRQLEAAHHGEFVAISDDGHVLLGADELPLSVLAVEKFGAGNVALRKIGTEANGHALAVVA